LALLYLGAVVLASGGGPFHAWPRATAQTLSLVGALGCAAMALLPGSATAAGTVSWYDWLVVAACFALRAALPPRNP
jgi:hypothetical protein